MAIFLKFVGDDRMKVKNIFIGLILFTLLAAPLIGMVLAAQPGGPAGISLPAGTTLGPYGQVISANATPTVAPRMPGGGGPQGINLSPGMTLGPHGEIIPANATPIATPRMHTGGGPDGINLSPGMTLGPHGKIVPA